MSALRAGFRPEFLNRVDEIVLFKPLTQAEVERVTELMLGDLRARLAERQISLGDQRGSAAVHREPGL